MIAEVHREDGGGTGGDLQMGVEVHFANDAPKVDQM
jgi:hypothetical protein